MSSSSLSGGKTTEGLVRIAKKAKTEAPASNGTLPIASKSPAPRNSASVSLVPVANKGATEAPLASHGTLPIDPEAPPSTQSIEAHVEAALEKFAEKIAEKYVTKEEHKLLKEEQKLLKGRLDHIAEVFQPATDYALFETAIYEFVEKKIPNGWEHQTGKIKYGISVFCSHVLGSLIVDSEDPPPKNFGWQGPSRKTNFPNEAHLPLVLAGLAGLVVYIQLIEKEQLVNWDPVKRNNLAHNGGLLHSLFATPDKEEGGKEYMIAKKKIKDLRAEFKESAENGSTFVTGVDDGISAVVNALAMKHNIWVDDVKKNKVVSALKSKYCSE